jgi:hypothetical protein
MGTQDFAPILACLWKWRRSREEKRQIGVSALLSALSSSLHSTPQKVVIICDYSGPCLCHNGLSRKTSAEAVTFCDHLSDRHLIFCTLLLFTY